jgi:crotonobetaine/carnitine-CoA ligase
MTDWPDAITLSTAWRRSVDRAPASVFLRFEPPNGEITEWTYSEFDDVVVRCAADLRSFGVGQGSAVHLALTNSPAFVALWLATVGLGGWIVPSDPMGTTPELAGHIARTAPVVGFCATTRRAVYGPAAAVLAGGLRVVEVDESDATLQLFGDDRIDAWPELPLRQRAAVMFTSGTTGLPKGVEITQANYAFAGATMAAAAGLEAHHRQLVVLPLFHANAQFYSFASAIWAGASVALVHTFSASRFLTQAAAHGATHASLFAAPIRMILLRAAPPAAPVGLQHCWYAMNITASQHATLTSWLGCRPRQLYGMTETLPAVLTEPSVDPVPSSMGYPTDGCQVGIQRGEIVVGGERGIRLFAGYLDDPATTAAAFRSGWFLTGDRARRAADGRFLFDGRRSDVLKVAGENVSTVEVEQVLAAFPGVLEVAVVGQPDEIRDEVPVAFVVPDDAANPPSVDALHEWCLQRLTKAKRPRDITLVEQLPRTSVGKIRKFLLRDPNAAEHRSPSRDSGSPAHAPLREEASP